MSLSGWRANRATVVSTTLAGGAYAGVVALSSGSAAAASALLGTAVVVAFFLTGQVPLLGTPARPGTRMAVLLVSYTARLAVLLIAARLLSRAEGVDARVLGRAVLVAAGTWTLTLLVSFLRARIPVVVPAAPTPGAAGTTAAADRVPEP